MLHQISHVVCIRNRALILISSPVAGVLNLEMFGNNRFFAFLNALDHEVQKSGGCTSDPLLAFSQFKMASKMAAE